MPNLNLVELTDVEKYTIDNSKIEIGRFNNKYVLRIKVSVVIALTVTSDSPISVYDYYGWGD